MKQQYTRISAYALITQDEKILLCRISNELSRWAGQWTLPGGGIEFGEDPEGAVVREVEEETGLVVSVRSITHVDSITDDSGEHDFHGIRLIYEVDIIGGELRDEVSGTTDRVMWMDRDEMEKNSLVDLAEVGVKLVYRNNYDH